MHRDLKTVNVNLNVINAKFPLTYGYISINNNDVIDVLYNFRIEIRVIRAQAYI
jgi:hypothetical protein